MEGSDYPFIPHDQALSRRTKNSTALCLYINTMPAMT
jgi:hypothetical protein